MQYLEKRVHRLEQRLLDLAPGIDLDTLDVVTASTSQIPSCRSSSDPPPQTSTHPIRGAALQADSPSDAASKTVEDLTNGLNDFHLDRYDGRGALRNLTQSFTDLRDSVLSEAEMQTTRQRDDESLESKVGASVVAKAIILDGERYMHDTALPPDDLVRHLLPLYRRHVHASAPCLHWPSFMRLFDSGTHIHDSSFRSLVFVVLAHAACYSEDPRVMPDPGIYGGGGGGNVPEEAKGLQWILASFHLSSRLFGPPASLYDLQFIALSLEYLWRNTSMLFAWTYFAPGFRRFIDAGAHRQISKRWNSSFVDDELRKRAWWSMILADKAAALQLGRPASIQERDYDVQYPLPISDEEIERLDRLHRLHPERPLDPNMDSSPPMQAFLASDRLYDIATQAFDSLERVMHGEDRLVAMKEKHQVIVKVDSALNAFKAELPSVLQWPPKPENEIYASQIAYIHILHHLAQVRRITGDTYSRNLVADTFFCAQTDVLPRGRSIRSFQRPHENPVSLHMRYFSSRGGKDAV